MGGRAELTADAPRAELVADRGEAAQTADFFRSRAFYDAEGVTHTLRIEDAGVGDRLAPARPRDPRHRAVGCDLAVRIPRRRRARGTPARPLIPPGSTGPARGW